MLEHDDMPGGSARGARDGGERMTTEHAAVRAGIRASATSRDVLATAPAPVAGRAR
jgi:hypothetical protein